MTKLPLTVPLGAGEPATSFASRLGRRNGVLKLREFCRDMLMNPLALTNGDEAALLRLALLGGVEGQALLDASIRRHGHTYTLAGQRLARKYLSRTRLQACPFCLEDDIRASDLQPTEAAFCRASWQIAWITTCSVHGSSLVDFAQADARDHSDTAAALGPHLDNLDAFKDASAQRAPNALEAYLSARLAGRSNPTPLLDELEFDVAARTCEMVGILALGHRKPRQLDASQLHEARGLGFGIASQGESGIRSFLADVLRDASKPARAGEHAWAASGQFYVGLVRTKGDPAYDRLRSILRDQMIRTLPIGAGEVIFGEVVERRILHSVRTASSETGAHPKRLRKLLLAHGHLTPAQSQLPNHSATFVAGAAQELLEKVKGALSAKHAGEHLGTNHVQTGLLIRAGILRPFSQPGDGHSEYLLARAEMDRFLAALLSDAVPTSQPDARLCDLVAASARTVRPMADIVTLILERRLRWVAQDVAKKGFASVLVDLDEVRAHFKGKDLDGLPPSRLSRHLRTCVRPINALIADGVLVTVTRTHPISRRQVNIIPYDQVQKFDQTYITLTTLARRHRIYARTAKIRLEAAGIRPAFDVKRIKATIYKRADVADFEP